MRRFLFVIGLFLSWATLFAQDGTEPYADFYVSTVGNDNWSGTLVEPNTDRTDGPFATIGRAKDAVRFFKQGKYRNIYVLIRGGEYVLSESEVFTPRDGHYDSFKIYYKAYPGETPVFHSDIAVEGWKIAKGVKGLPNIAKGKVYVAQMPKLPAGKERFYTMYENGQLLQRASSKEFNPTKIIPGGDGGGTEWRSMIEADRQLIHVPDGIVKNWDNLGDIEVFAHVVGYLTDYLTLASVNVEDNTLRTTLPTAYPTRGVCKIENVIDYLDSPGEWVVNTQKGLIYYWPMSGKPGKVTVPALTQYFFVDGHEMGGIVRNLAFEGLTFTRGDRAVITKNDIGLQHEWDMWNKANAMLRFRDVEFCEVDACRFTNNAAGAIRFDLHAQRNIVKNNLIDYVGGIGVLLCGYGPGTKDVNKSNRIINNEIHHCGEFLYHSPAIMIWQSGNNIIKNNKLHHTPYTPVILSGTRPMFFQIDAPNKEQVGGLRTFEMQDIALYQDTVTRHERKNHTYSERWPKVAPYYLTRDNIVEENNIFFSMQKLFDGNAIYLSDVGDNNKIIRNYIHHFNKQGMSQGIRTDAFIKNTTIAENIIYNFNGGGINLKYYNNHAYNNIIANIHDIDHGGSRIWIGYFSLMDVYYRDKMPPYSSCNIENNILYRVDSHNTFYRQGWVNKKLTELKLEECNIDNNLYYDVNLRDNGLSALQYYKSRGIDANSIVGDPMFRNIDNGDFRLKEGSPAYNIGFKDIDMSRIGLTKEFPAAYKAIVKKQLGEDYDDFKTLEKNCMRSGNDINKVNEEDDLDFENINKQ